MPSRILIADDSTIMRAKLKALLESHPGWSVCCAVGNGLEAVQGAKEHKPDLVMLDLTMPVMDGLRAARVISSSYPTLPILMYTNHPAAAVAREAEKHGVRKIVSKGDRGDGIVAAIEALLSVRPDLADSEQPAGVVDAEKPPILGQAAKASGSGK
jgi:DNA-binding NarL/FixJ family response regulator